MPAGQSQTRNYDAAGNLTTLIDYNGHTTTYEYDALNRLITKIPDAATGDVKVTFTYTATGKRWTMADASGTTTYAYDNLDRLITKATPQGTLTYTYDAAGNVASMVSNNDPVHGMSVSYTYDNLNRLATVVDNRLVGQNTTTYLYDPASNLATVTYPNGLSSNFTYDDLNRLTKLNNYQYTLDPYTGMRKGVTEPNGRTASWNYDGINRLTNETINSNSVAYTLDPVGNRQSQTSTIPGISSAGPVTFDADDRLSTESYDPNGNTLKTGNRTFTYDFENRLQTMALNTDPVSVTLQYDGDGNRVAKTVGGTTTRYLVDDLNPTGYAQVVEELGAGGVQRTYTYGSQRINQNQLINSVWTPSFYGYDGFGSVRTLTNAASTVTDTYDYDAWGNAINTTGSTPNVYLYLGEQYDPDLRLYYLRARYLNPLSGRFLTRNPEPGSVRDPASLHQYLYVLGNPVNAIDPTGHPEGVEYNLTMIRGGSALGPVESAVAAGRAAVQTFLEIEARNARMLYLHAGDVLKLIKAAAKLTWLAKQVACVLVAFTIERLVDDRLPDLGGPVWNSLEKGTVVAVFDRVCIDKVKP
jgi:RHS repeat-associated protein